MLQNRELPLRLDYVPMRRQDVLAQGTDDSLMLFDMESGNYFSLNEIGSRVWELSDGSRNLQQIALQLEQEYDAPSKLILQDLMSLVSTLEDNHLLTQD